MNIDRKKLQRDADRLGLPWTNRTTDDELQYMLKEESGMSVQVKKGEDGKFYWNDFPQPDCFGIYWEDIGGPLGKDCSDCEFSPECLSSFLKTTLLAGIKKTGSTEIDVLSKHLEISEECVTIVLSHLSKSEPKKVESKKVPPKKLPPKKLPPKKVPPKKVPSSKKVTKNKSTEKVTPPRPLGAVSVKSVKDAVKIKPKSVKNAMARVGSRVPFGEHTFLGRWERERARSPKIAALKINSKLSITRKGKTHTCVVKLGYYQHGEEKFPTLYKLTEHITGKGSNWSGPKFWKLT